MNYRLQIIVVLVLTIPVARADKRLQKIDEQRRELRERIENFQPPMGEKLVLIGHGDTISELYKDLYMLDYDDPRTPLGAALAMKGVSHEQLVEVIVQTVMRRKPEKDELKLGTKHLRERANEPKKAILELVWALCNSKEFRDVARKKN